MFVKGVEEIFHKAALIDINNADFTVPSDRDRIFGKVKQFPRGFDGLIAKVKGSLGASYFSSKVLLVHPYSIGDEDTYRSIIADA